MNSVPPHGEPQPVQTPSSPPDRAVILACSVLAALYDRRLADAQEKRDELTEDERAELQDTLLDMLVLVRTGQTPRFVS